MHEQDVILHSEVAMTALVTEASSDIGIEFCRQLASMGINLIMISYQMEPLAALRDSLASQYPNQRFWAFFNDLSDSDAPGNIYQFCQANGIIVDVLVNNACILDVKDITDTSALRLNSFFNQNFRTLSLLCLRFGSDMKRRCQGYILNVASVPSMSLLPGFGMFDASSAYIRAFSRTLHLELKTSGVGVTVACLGGTATDLFRLHPNYVKWGLRLRLLRSPSRFVKGALFCMFNHKKQFLNGFINRFALVLISVFPDRIKLMLKHKTIDNNVTK